MPQMMPINWLMSFMFFIIIFIIFNILNYYITNNNLIMNKNKYSNKKLMHNLNWKW